jgi:subtilisin
MQTFSTSQRKVRLRFVAKLGAVGGVVVLALGLVSAPDRIGTVEAAASAGVIPEHYVVVFKDTVGDPKQVADEHARQHGAAVSQVYGHALRGYAARIPAQRLAAVRADSRVLFVSEDREVQASGQQAPTGLRRAGGSTNGVNQTLANKGAGVGVAVIDTGIDLSHPDLTPVVNGKTCILGTKNANDDNGHGSHVAGTIAARDNGGGVVGVAPGATLYAVKVLDRSGSGSWSSVICGIDWVTANANKVAVANMSLGGGGSDDGNCGNSNNDALHRRSAARWAPG